MDNYHVIANLFEEIEVPETGMLSRTLHSDDNVRIILFGFSPGHELARHTAPVPVLIQILSGEALVTVDANTTPAAEGCLIQIKQRPSFHRGADIDDHVAEHAEMCVL